MPMYPTQGQPTAHPNVHTILSPWCEKSGNQTFKNQHQTGYNTQGAKLP
jgi:hypothetical protein